MMRKWIACCALTLALLLAASGLADAQFLQWFGDGVDGDAGRLFDCPDAAALEALHTGGTGIVVLGTPGDGWTRQAVDLCCELCRRTGIGVVHYAAPEDAGALAEEAVRYISRWDTSFSNVNGSRALIDAILGGSEAPEGVVLFINKGTLIAAQVGTSPEAAEPGAPDPRALEEIMAFMTKYAGALGGSPCPSHC